MLTLHNYSNILGLMKNKWYRTMIMNAEQVRILEEKEKTTKTNKQTKKNLWAGSRIVNRYLLNTSTEYGYYTNLLYTLYWKEITSLAPSNSVIHKISHVWMFLTVFALMSNVLWDELPCILVEGYQHSMDNFCLHPQGRRWKQQISLKWRYPLTKLQKVTSHKTIIQIIITVGITLMLLNTKRAMK